MTIDEHLIGSRSLISKRTQIRLLVDGPPNANGWVAKTLPNVDKGDVKKESQITLQINSPSDAIIGKYNVSLHKMKVFL